MQHTPEDDLLFFQIADEHMESNEASHQKTDDFL